MLFITENWLGIKLFRPPVVPLEIDLLCIVLKNVVYDCTLQMLLVCAGQRDYSKINCHNLLLLMSYFSDFLGEDCSHIKALCVLVTELDNVFNITRCFFTYSCG